MPLLTIPERYRRNFQDRMVPAIQQTQQLLAQTYTLDPTWTAKEKVFEDLSSVTLREGRGRHADTDPAEVTGENRKLSKRFFDVSHLFGQKDEKWLDTLSMPQSEVIDAYDAAFNRKLDQRLVLALSETVYQYNEEGAPTAITFPANNTIAVDYVLSGAAANSGLTLEKLFKVIERARKDQVLQKVKGGDGRPITEPLTLVIGPEDELDLVKQLKANANNEVWGKLIGMWLEDRSHPLLGYFNVEVSDFVEVSSADIATVVAYQKKSVVMSPLDLMTDISVRKDKSYSVQIYASGDFGVGRRHDKGIYRILCDRSP